MKEIWKPIPGYDDRYAVSNLGRVKSRPRKLEGTILDSLFTDRRLR